MKKNIGCVILAGLFFATSPARATITADLETPEDMQNASGITLVRGWAFSSLGGTVIVTLRVNGSDVNPITVLPCCTGRADVKALHPEAPLTTGFSTQINY